MKALREGYNAWLDTALMESDNYGILLPGFTRYISTLSHNALKLYTYITIHSRHGQIELDNGRFAGELKISSAEVERTICELQGNLLIGVVDDTIVMSLYATD